MNRILPLVLGFVLTGSFLLAIGEEDPPCMCDSLWPHMRAVNYGYTTVPCQETCGVSRLIQDIRCKSGSYCQQCNTPDDPFNVQWCVFQECGFVKLHTETCPLINTQ